MDDYSISSCSARKKRRKKKSRKKLEAANSVTNVSAEVVELEFGGWDTVTALSTDCSLSKSSSRKSSRKKKKKEEKKLERANSAPDQDVELDDASLAITALSIDDTVSNCTTRKKRRKKKWRKKLETGNSISDLLGDVELDPSRAQQAMKTLRKASKKDSYIEADFVPVMVSYEDVALIVSELEVSEEVAERVLREVALEGGAEDGKMLEAALRKLVTA